MTKAAGKERRDRFGWLRAIDDGVFAAEQAVVSLALMAITVLMFVNVVARRVDAPDSKVGALIAKFGGVSSPETRAWIDATVAPWVSVATAFGLVVFGYYTWRRLVHRRRELDPPTLRSVLPMASLVALLIIGAGFGFAHLMRELESSVIFAGLFGFSALGLIIRLLVGRPEGFAIKAAAAAAIGAGSVWFATTWFPIGYTWTNKVALMLLLWVGMLGASVCVHQGKHIRMEGLANLAPERARPYVNALGFLLAAAFTGVMTWLGWLYTFGPMGAYELGGHVEGTDIPDWVGTFSVVVGFGLATLRFFAGAVSHALGGHYGRAASDEELEEARAHAAASKAASHGAAR